jgi:uncharacterized protein (UPF0276 family)
MAIVRFRLPTTTIHPESAGVALPSDPARDVVERDLGIDFFEVHAESYMGDGGPPHRLLRRISADYPIALHSTGLSIGADHPPDREHLTRLRHLVDRYRPSLCSVPLAWSTHEGAFLNAELPLPYNGESLASVCDNVDRAQRELGMQILLENPASYLALEASAMSEGAFLRAAVARTGCGLLLDIGNVYVSAINLGFEAMGYIDSFPVEDVKEIHLAGLSEETDDDGNRLLIDDHSGPVSDGVWAIYRRTLGRIGPLPTVIERRSETASLPELSATATIVKQALGRAARQSANRPQPHIGISP